MIFDVNALAAVALNWLESYKIPDLITTMAAVALLFVSIDFYRQHQSFPQRRYVLLLAIFFLFDGLDYMSFVLQSNGVFFELLGVICDAGVAATAIIAMFSIRDTIQDRRNKPE